MRIGATTEGVGDESSFDFTTVHQHVRVGVGGHELRCLSRPGADLGPADALVVPEADPTVTQIVRAVERDAGGLARSGHLATERALLDALEDRGFEIAVLSRHERVNGGEDIGRNVDPATATGLLVLTRNAPPLA